jgi:predicted nucleotide-binding protein
MRVFVGSSSQGSKELAAVLLLVEKAHMTPKPWSRPGTFFVSGGTWEALLDMTRDVDAAAFVFREDDQSNVNNQLMAVTRDNVILEFGLFSGALGARHCAIFRKGESWIPNDLKGVTYISLDNPCAEDEVRRWADQMRAEVELPFNLSIEQIAAVAKAMLMKRIPMNEVYHQMRKLGVPEVAVDDALNPKRSRFRY